MVFFVFVVLRIPLNENFIAVMLTLIAYSINDTIIIYDRIRENMALNSKMPIDEVVDLSITQSLTRSINTNLTLVAALVVLCVFAVLYNLASIYTFALPLAVGTIVGAYSSLCIATSLWVMWEKRRRKAAE